MEGAQMNVHADNIIHHSALVNANSGLSLFSRSLVAHRNPPFFGHLQQAAGDKWRSGARI
jgi:hypothetical protein